MKLFKTLIFIFVLLALLAVISVFFPKEGLQVGPVHLTFPKLHEVLSFQIEDNSKEIELTPEEIQRKEMEALKQAQDSTFLDFCMNSPIRISMPRKRISLVDTISIDNYELMSDSAKTLCDSIKMIIDSTAHRSASSPVDTLWVVYRDSVTEERDLTYLDDFFEALDSARYRHVRIMHYGDSQLEEDRITSGLREHFQEQFGGGGPGLMPAQKWITKLTCFQSTSPELPYYVAYGTSTMHARHNGYGPMATVAQASGNVRISFTTTKNEKFRHVREFDRVTILRNNPDGSGLQYRVQEFDSVRSKVTVSIQGPAYIYGVMLDQKTGVSMDNIPMRGSSGNIFTRITRNTIEPFFQKENVRLIILQYGGNSVPYLKSEKRLQEYKKSLIAQIELFKSMSPETKILFIGPADMATNVKGKKETYPQLEPTINMLKEVCSETGIAFWNLYDAMGGHNSMIEWVNANLAGKDYLHFTRDGASKVADMLFETYLMYYRFYCKRTGKEPKNFNN